MVGRLAIGHTGETPTKGNTMIYALWHGGSSYAAGDPVANLESFPSLSAARDAMERRFQEGAFYTQNFEFVNREPERVFCPVVGEDSSMLVWMTAEVEDGVTYVGDYPDGIFERTEGVAGNPSHFELSPA